MIDLTNYVSNFQIGFGLTVIALVVVLRFFAKFPDPKPTKK